MKLVYASLACVCFSLSAFAVHPNAKELDKLNCYVTMVPKGGTQTRLAFSLSPKGQLVVKHTTTTPTEETNLDLQVDSFSRSVSDFHRYSEADEDYKITRSGEPKNYEISLAKVGEKNASYRLTYSTEKSKYVNAKLNEYKQDVQPISLWCYSKQD